jgi:oxaloacetate decarboxylase alpha subunit
VSNLREAAAAVIAAGKTFHAGLVYSRGRSGEIGALVEAAKRLPELGASRIILNDPTDALLPHLTEELVQRIGEATSLPVGLYVQGAAGTGLVNAIVATRVGADLVATAVYPLALTLHRVAGESLVEALHGLGRQTGVSIERLWQASDVIDEHIGDEPVAPVAPRIAVRAAEYDLPAGLVAALDVHLRANGAGDRLLDTLAEVGVVRAEAGWPPLAAPIGQILASQALLNVLSARRYGSVLDEFRLLVEGAYGATPADVDETVQRAVALLGVDTPALEDDPPSAEDVLEAAEGLASSEEDLVLLAMFGEEAETLLRTIRQRHSREASLLAGDVDAQRAERIRELVKIVQESGVGEIEIEDEGMRVSVRRADEPQSFAQPVPAAAVEEGMTVTPAPRRATAAVRVESPMVGVFYRAPQPGAPPFVEVGDIVTAGQTLCLLEAMKLFNELKADVDGRVRAIHAETGQSVEFGSLLFELDPVDEPPAV